MSRAYRIRPMIPAEDISARVAELADAINGHFAGTDKLVVVGLLRGSFVFIADLVRRLDLPVEVDFIEAASYGMGMESAREVRPHPFILRHPENGRDTLLGCLGYIVGVEGMAEEEALELLLELHAWQTREEFQYIHEWDEGMLVMWDNRSVLHKANGGYDGYDRELYRITVASDPEKFLRAAAP